ncbi:MAG TPA: hypothetical protein VJB65_02205 [Patescibacteria group bacterium]|nr:hypothetical protein [Patescibacteria group bacterium]
MTTKQLVKKIDVMQRELNVMRLAISTLNKGREGVAWKKTAGIISLTRSKNMMRAIQNDRQQILRRERKLDTLHRKATQ